MVQKKLFEDRYRVFYDAARRGAPRTKAEYLAADHATVMYDESNRKVDLDAHLEAEGVFRRFVVLVPGFAGVPAFLRGSDLVATAPSLQRFGAFQGLAHATPPIACPTLRKRMYMIWSRGDHGDPRPASWLRGRTGGGGEDGRGRARGERAVCIRPHSSLRGAKRRSNPC